MFVIACGDGGIVAGGVSGTGAEASSVPPTFIRVAVTPAPTETPTPTAVPTATITLSTFSRDTPIFPDAFDPEHVDVRPEDSAIFAGWTSYMSNTELNHAAAEEVLHLCSNGVVMTDAGLHPTIQNWRIHRSVAISSVDWGMVNIEVELISGRFAGRKRGIMTLERRIGKVFITNLTSPSEAFITRSSQCLGMLD